MSSSSHSSSSEQEESTTTTKAAVHAIGFGVHYFYQTGDPFPPRAYKSRKAADAAAAGGGNNAPRCGELNVIYNPEDDIFDNYTNQPVAQAPAQQAQVVLPACSDGENVRVPTPAVYGSAVSFPLMPRNVGLTSASSASVGSGGNNGGLPSRFSSGGGSSPYKQVSSSSFRKSKVGNKVTSMLSSAAAASTSKLASATSNSFGLESKSKSEPNVTAGEVVPAADSSTSSTKSGPGVVGAAEGVPSSSSLKAEEGGTSPGSSSEAGAAPEAQNGDDKHTTTVSSQTPVDVATAKNELLLSRNSTTNVQQVTCGATHTAVLTKSGDIYTMGTLHGTVYTKPTLCKTRLPVRCTQLAHGRRHVLALMEGGSVVLSWGAGHFGQLGHGEITHVEYPKVLERLLPQVIGGRVTTVAAGGLHSAALVDLGNNQTRTFAWGFNRRGQCGTEGGKCNTVPHPTPVVNVTVEPKDGDFGGSAGAGKTVCFEKLALGRLHTVALSTDGSVYCWGANSGGRCGLGETHHRSSSSSSSIPSPQRVPALRGTRIAEIAAGDRHSLALDGNGQVYSWGVGNEGQLGHGHTVSMNTPRVVADLDFGTRQHVQYHIRRRRRVGSVRRGSGSLASVASGEGAGILGGGLSVSDSHDSNSVPLPPSGVPTYPNPPRVTKIYASGSYSAALIGATGDLFTWGYGDAGQLGHLPLPAQNSPELPRVEPGPPASNPPSPTAKTGGNGTGAGVCSGGRLRDSKSFDSRLNVLLPRRVTCTRNWGLKVVDVALGPAHMITLCQKREVGRPPTGTGDGESQIGGEQKATTLARCEIGEEGPPVTLYEIELGRRSKGLARLRAMGSTRVLRASEEGAEREKERRATESGTSAKPIASERKEMSGTDEKRVAEDMGPPLAGDVPPISTDDTVPVREDERESVQLEANEGRIAGKASSGPSVAAKSSSPLASAGVEDERDVPNEKVVAAVEKSEAAPRVHSSVPSTLPQQPQTAPEHGRSPGRLSLKSKLFQSPGSFRKTVARKVKDALK